MLVSIGYKGVAIEGSEPWFEASRGILRNQNGLVDPATEILGGLYVSGWLKRGPSGIIGTNITDAKDTVTTILHDLKSIHLKTVDTKVEDLLTQRNIQFINWAGVEKIEAAETSRSRKRNQDQPREKITSRPEFLKVALS